MTLDDSVTHHVTDYLHKSRSIIFNSLPAISIKKKPLFNYLKVASKERGRGKVGNLFALFNTKKLALTLVLKASTYPHGQDRGKRQHRQTEPKLK